MMKTLFTFLIIFLLVSCSSLPTKIQQNIDKHDFTSALELLNKEGVGKEIVGTPSKEAIEARNLYSKSIYEFYKLKVWNELNEGKPKEADKSSSEALVLCSWYEPIIKLKEYTNSVVTKIDEIERKWIFYSSNESLSYKEGKKIAHDISAISDIISDSPKILSLYKNSLKSIVKHWVKELDDKPIPFSEVVLSQINEDLEYFPFVSEEKDRIIKLFKNLNLLPLKISYQDNSFPIINSSSIDSVREFLSLLNERYDYLYLDDFNKVAISKWDIWIKNDLLSSIENTTISFDTINMIEFIYANNKGNLGADLVRCLTEQHIKRARIRSNQGKDALLSLLHLSRYQILVNEPNQQFDEIRQTVSNSLNSAINLKATIFIEADNYVEPEIFKLIQFGLYLKITQKTREYFDWEWYSKPYAYFDFKVSIKKADHIRTTYNDLRTVNSEYLSHFEDTPNPMKSFWESQLSSAEFNVNMAENSYNNAVSSHNYYPTQYSLANVNNRYTNYQMAIDNYNRIVNNYNSTPTTISKPVYLPYQFTEGDIEHGWKISIDYEINNSSDNFYKELIETDFIRVGSKYNDVNENYRNDDYIDIDISTTNSIEKLSFILDNFLEDYSDSFCSLNLTSNTLTDGYEKYILNVLNHPFGFEYAYKCENLEDWIYSSIKEITLPEPVLIQRLVRLERCEYKSNNKDIKDFISFHEKHICEIETDLSTGTGVLISKDGLILTCAHVLFGNKLNANFIDNKSYPCETVFIDEINDVALIKANNFYSKTWANMQLNRNFIKGEEVIAIGNPALSRNIKNRFGATKGIISNPLIETTETKRMVCDLTVASGSSGGPIFSLDTGEIIGIVTAVGEAGFDINNDQISSSGYLCLSAPSSEIKSWLNIAYVK